MDPKTSYAGVDYGPYALIVRPLPDGRIIVVLRMIFNDRLCIGDQGDGGYHRGWCYPQDGSAVFASVEWNGDGVPPGPVIKEVGSG